MATTENLGLTLRTAADETIQALVTDYNSNMETIDGAIGSAEFLDVEFNESEILVEKDGKIQSALTAYRVGNILYVNGALVPLNVGTDSNGNFRTAGWIKDVNLYSTSEVSLGDVQFPIAGYGGYGEGVLMTSGNDVLVTTCFPSIGGAYRLNFTVPVK